MKTKILSVLILALSCAWIFSPESFAMREADATSGQPIVVTNEGSTTVTPAPSAVIATGGLTDKEKKEMEQNYRYNVRGKAALLNPYLAAGENNLSADDESPQVQLEQEKLYKYFGVAMDLYREGRLDEAIEILRYVSDKNPDDDYVKKWLERISNENVVDKKRLTAESTNNARLMKAQTLKDMMRDGIDYYKQQRYDMALLKFADLLAFDPGNAEARRYLDKLKAYYLKEVRVDDIVNSYELKSRSGRTDSIDKITELSGKESGVLERVAREELDKQEKEAEHSLKFENTSEEKLEKLVSAADKILDDAESKPKGLVSVADKVLNDEEMKALIKEKRVGIALDQAELGLTVDDIIVKKRDEEQRRNLFTLGSGDVIQISVRDHPELSGKAVVRMDGNVILPLVNDAVQIKGLTVDEATDKISEAMKRYLKDPYVVVVIDEYRSKIFYVIDEVGCTSYPITRANITLRDALFISDWGDNRALGRVIVMKPNKLHPMVRKIDAFDIIYRGNLANNIRIEDGDVIYMPLTVAAKVSKTIADSMRPIGAIRQVRDEWNDLKWNSQDGWRNLGKIPSTQAQQSLWQDPNANTSVGNFTISASSLSN